MSLRKLVAFCGALLLFASSFACPVENSASDDQTAAYVVARCIDDAKFRVWIAAEYMTHPQIGRALAKAKAREVDVQVVMHPPEHGQKYSLATYLRNHSIPVYFNGADTTVDKNFLVVDDRFVGDFEERQANGLRAWTQQAMGSVTQGSPRVGPAMRLRDDPQLNAAMADEFRKLTTAGRRRG